MSITAEKKMAEKKPEQNIINPSLYGCELLLEKTTMQQVKDPSFPTDAYIIWYVVDNIEHMDLCRTKKRSLLFDLYYDKYGPGSVKKIDWGYGRVNPRTWGYTPKEGKKRK